MLNYNQQNLTQFRFTVDILHKTYQEIVCPSGNLSKILCPSGNIERQNFSTAKTYRQKFSRPQFCSTSSLSPLVDNTPLITQQTDVCARNDQWIAFVKMKQGN